MLVITPALYHAGRYRDLADRIMQNVGYLPNMVMEIRVAEGLIEVDWIWLDDQGRPRLVAGHVVTRTTTITPASTSATVTA